MRERGRMHPSGNETREVWHVDHEVRADRVGDLAETPEVPDARIGGAARDDDLRLRLVGDALDFVIVDEVVLAADMVRRDLEPLSRHVDGRAMREMATGGKIEAH